MESDSCDHFGCFFQTNMWLVLVRTLQLAFWNCSFLDSSIRRLDLAIYLPMLLCPQFTSHQPSQVLPLPQALQSQPEQLACLPLSIVRHYMKKIHGNWFVSCKPVGSPTNLECSFNPVEGATVSARSLWSFAFQHFDKKNEV